MHIVPNVYGLLENVEGPYFEARMCLYKTMKFTGE